MQLVGRSSQDSQLGLSLKDVLFTYFGIKHLTEKLSQNSHFFIEYYKTFTKELKGLYVSEINNKYEKSIIFAIYANLCTTQ